MRNSDVHSRSRSALVLSAILAALTVFDIVLHVAIDQVEPLRISGNLVVLAAALAVLLVPVARRAWIPALAGAISLALNLVFVAREGIGTMGAILVAVSTAMCAAIAIVLARQPR
ncbi:hypothetical protein IT882_06720 [Microbacterium schleiferi]|uniref:Integral membrane protein n=1 Tax=Microbacterium schleiferi TaxID=69362 RepID=A0A7S8MYM0_9MICO|nr:hypothetical protein [Microbacterium schleiferi]QPE05674.1 hypothetical protein IT882_06720 [Microbacterium schleiferi]